MISVIWLIVALVTWPLVALGVGLLLGRGLAAAEAHEPRPVVTTWLRRELPPAQVAPLPHDQTPTPI